MALNYDETEIYVVDYKTTEIKVIDIYGDKPLQKIKSDTLHSPLNIILTEGLNSILVTNYADSSMVLFDRQFNFQKAYKDIIDANMVIDHIDIDDLDRIYMVHNHFNKVTIYDLKNNQKVSEFGANEPWNIKVKNDKIILISFTYWEWSDRSERKIKRISKGDNCINIIDKHTLEIREIIRIDGWLRPDGLCFGPDGNLVTTAFLIDKETSVVSDYRFLFVLNQNFELLREFYLDQIYYITDFLHYSNKLLFCGGDEGEKQWVKMFEIK